VEGECGETDTERVYFNGERGTENCPTLKVPRQRPRLSDRGMLQRG
jgi:hypothetical protein